MEGNGSRIIRAIEVLLREAVEKRDWERVGALSTLRRQVEAQRPDWRVRDAAADLWTLRHAGLGPLATFRTRDEAEADLAAVLRDEPGWADDLSIEPFQFVVSEQ